MEPVCGAALAGVYGEVVEDVVGQGPVVVFVGGGNIVNLDTLNKGREELKMIYELDIFS